jgi:hypothetical protein
MQISQTSQNEGEGLAGAGLFPRQVAEFELVSG